jgi:hypothetical protein
MLGGRIFAAEKHGVVGTRVLVRLSANGALDDYRTFGWIVRIAKSRKFEESSVGVEVIFARRPILDGPAYYGIVVASTLMNGDMNLVASRSRVRAPVASVTAAGT